MKVYCCEWLGCKKRMRRDYRPHHGVFCKSHHPMFRAVQYAVEKALRCGISCTTETVYQRKSPVTAKR